MTNYDAVSYAKVALINLQKNNQPIHGNMLSEELYYLFDIFSIVEIHNELLRLTNHNLWKRRQNY